MPVDIRATVACSLGTVISGNVNDEYVQGTGLIKCSGTVVINGIITPAIGTAVTFTYTKSGVTRSIPRKLRVLSSFADPFRRTTSVELGCKLTYLSDKRDSIDWTAFDDTENTLTEADAKIVTISIRAQAVAKKCMDELGVFGTFTLTNKFSVARFDLSPGYVQVLSDLLVSESLCGYLDANEVLQVFSLDQPGGTGPVLDATQLVDIGKIGVGQLPGEAVTVSYSTLKLKRDVPQKAPDDISTAPETGNGNGGTEGGGDGGTEGGGDGENQEQASSDAFNPNLPWYNQRTVNIYSVSIEFRSPTTNQPDSKYANILEVTTVSTQYAEKKTIRNGVVTVPVERITVLETRSPAIMGSILAEYLTAGIPVVDVPVSRQTVETFEYDAEGIESFYSRYVVGGFGFVAGAVSLPFVFSRADFVEFQPNAQIAIEYETRSTITTALSRQVTTTLYVPWYKTQNGQQAIAAARSAMDAAYWVELYLNRLAAMPLTMIDQRVEIVSGQTGPTSAPSPADVINARAAVVKTTQSESKAPRDKISYRTESKAELTLALGSATAQRRIELSLPYAPDDVFTKSGSTYGSAASDAAAKAQLYGRVQNRLLLGNRSGMNLQCAPEILPGAPFAPFVVKSGSTSALYRTNGTNWTFDAQGLVASTDALFWGGVGGNAGESWFPVAPGITTLPTTPGTTTVNITDASGNVVGSYQQMTVTGTVPVAQETRLLQATLRVRPVVTSLPYALQQTAEVAITTRLRAVVTSIKSISVPAAAVTVASLAPKVSTGARVLVPAVAVQVAAQVPGVSSGASVAVPAAGITVTGVVPDVVGRQKTTVQVPVATVQVAGLAPLVATGASVSVAAAGVTVAGLLPEQVGLAKDPNFSSVSLLLHMDGSNGSTTFTDSSSNAHAITVFGNARLTTADKRYGTAALTLDGTVGTYVRTPADTDFALGTGDFAVECWCRPTVVSSNDGLFTFGDANSGLFLAAFSSGWYLGTAGAGGTYMGTATAGVWQHIAVTRSGTSLRLFINGTQLGSTLTNSTNLTGNQLKIGYYYDSTFGFVGLIDEFRVSKVARYTANFTPPTAPFPDA
jgi:hypothetical protein